MHQPALLLLHGVLLPQKKIKKLPHKEQLGPQGAPDALTEEETEFVQALSDTLNQLNDIYIEKEETSVIRVERLESELAAATTPQQFNELHKQFVDFHGEVLLLVHWSILAYTATVKILKKHHKRTGLLVRAPQLGNLLSQPFCSTEVSHHEVFQGSRQQRHACSQSTEVVTDHIAVFGFQGPSATSWRKLVCAYVGLETIACKCRSTVTVSPSLGVHEYCAVVLQLLAGPYMCCA
jgi:hypothetical protein